MSELARIEIEELRARRLIRISGEVDISNSRELASAIEASVSDVVEGVVIDLSGTTYLDSAAIELLFRLAARLQGRRLELRLLVPADAPTRAVLELTGLPQVVPLDTSLNDAASVDRGPAEPGY